MHRGEQWSVLVYVSALVYTGLQYIFRCFFLKQGQCVWVISFVSYCIFMPRCERHYVYLLSVRPSGHCPLTPVRAMQYLMYLMDVFH